MQRNVEEFVEKIAERGRILMLGGLAIIAHGLSRSTKDMDIWLEPFLSEKEWCAVLEDVMSVFPDAELFDLRNWCVVPQSEMLNIVDRDGLVRVIGLDRPLDIFRIPNNLEIEDFNDVWGRSIVGAGKIRIPDEIDLLVTKEYTSRSQDIADISFLEDKVRKRFSGVLEKCLCDEAVLIFKRYADHETCRAALKNPDSKVQALALSVLRDLAKEGDPFSAEIIKNHQE